MRPSASRILTLGAVTAAVRSSSVVAAPATRRAPAVAASVTTDVA